ncbi:MAG: endo alpha-1,4 polygalactosaminidase [Lachnospiraceae bacterium]|nr:endo alpha-1,4 polygalactosaminidase [Lachnospiraceae bacterium]
MNKSTFRICVGICAVLLMVAIMAVARSFFATNKEKAFKAFDASDDYEASDNYDAYDASYGVYIGAEPEELISRDLPEIIVIDAQYYAGDEISDLKEGGHRVYTYINIGSVEAFRDYYKDFENITLGAYENWEDEKWVDVSDERWQLFISDKADELIDKGVDGFFVDNCDVYYNYPTEEIFEGVRAILKNLCEKKAYVMINGGDEFVREYLKLHGNLDGILDGVNQESVYTAVDWENSTFSVNAPEDREYFLDYIKLVKDAGKDAYAIEYTTDPEIAQKAKELAATNGYTVYIADSLGLE